MNGQLTVTREFHVSRQQRGRKQLRDGAPEEVPLGRVPRIARLLALAIRCDQLIKEGAVASQSALSRAGHITTARMTQIMTLLHLAPDIQEQILFLPRVERGRGVIQEMDVRPIAATLDWRKQRRMWAALVRKCANNNASSR